jgi:hypothetical protein
MRTIAKVSVLVVAACGALTGVALAAKAGVYTTNAGESSGNFTVSGSKLTKITAQSNFKCNKLNAIIPVSVAIKSGSFSYTGKMKGQSGTITFKGHFTSSTKATGTTVITKGSCKSGTVKWTAKLVVSAP